MHCIRHLIGEKIAVCVVLCSKHHSRQVNYVNTIKRATTLDDQKNVYLFDVKASAYLYLIQAYFRALFCLCPGNRKY